MGSKDSALHRGGADIRELEGLDAHGCADFIALGHGVFGRLGRLPKPILAAVNGTCVGGGLELALACDPKLAARSARFGQPEVRLGVVSGWGGTQRLPRLVGKSRGLEMLMLGEPIGADEALAAISAPTRSRPPSTSSPSCRRTPTARSSSASCASRTGPGGTAGSDRAARS